MNALSSHILPSETLQRVALPVSVKRENVTPEDRAARDFTDWKPVAMSQGEKEYIDLITDGYIMDRLISNKGREDGYGIDYLSDEGLAYATARRESGKEQAHQLMPTAQVDRRTGLPMAGTDAYYML